MVGLLEMGLGHVKQCQNYTLKSKKTSYLMYRLCVLCALLTSHWVLVKLPVPAMVPMEYECPCMHVVTAVLYGWWCKAGIQTTHPQSSLNPHAMC